MMRLYEITNAMDYSRILSFLKKKGDKMVSIAFENRRESLGKIDKKRMYDLIISVLSHADQDGMTAREIAVELYNQGFIINNDRQATQPRLTELEDRNIVEVIDKRLDRITNRHVSVYSLVQGIS